MIDIEIKEQNVIISIINHFLMNGFYEWQSFSEKNKHIT